MSEELEGLSELASRALSAERRRPDVDGELAARLMARVAASVAAGGAASAGAVKAGTGTAAKVAASAKAAQLGLTAKAAPWIGLAFLAGGGTGAAVHAALTSSAPRVVETVTPPASTSIDRPVANVQSAPPSESVVPARALPDSSASVAPTRPTTTSSTAYEPDVSLSAERSLVERARTALARGDLDGALQAADAHATRFPKGRLQEEREAIAIQALAKLHRAPDAERRAQAFRKAHPNSVFLPTIDLAAP